MFYVIIRHNIHDDTKKNLNHIQKASCRTAILLYNDSDTGLERVKRDLSGRYIGAQNHTCPRYLKWQSCYNFHLLT